MKPTMKNALFVILSLLLLAHSSSAIVRDVDGNIVQNGGSYYILPVLKGKGGGLELGQTGNETCAISVVQSPSETSKGMPLRISSIHLSPYIFDYFPLWFWFDAAPTCGSGTAPSDQYWTVVDAIPFGWSVKLTGHHQNSVRGAFMIGKHEKEYKLVFCLYLTSICGDIGVKVDDDGVRQLVLGGEGGPLVVKFKKTDGYSTT